MFNAKETLKKMNKNTHCYEVLSYMNKRKKSGITSMDAFENLGVTRLSAVIYDLKNVWGVPIESAKVSYTAKNGRKTYFSRYYLGA